MPALVPKPVSTRERILESARAILVEEGFRALSTRAVATRAGCSIGTIYNHFRDFDDVVLHLNAETLTQLGEALASLQCADRCSSRSSAPPPASP